MLKIIPTSQVPRIHDNCQLVTLACRSVQLACIAYCSSMLNHIQRIGWLASLFVVRSAYCVLNKYLYKLNQYGIQLSLNADRVQQGPTLGNSGLLKWIKVVFTAEQRSLYNGFQGSAVIQRRELTTVNCVDVSTLCTPRIAVRLAAVVVTGYDPPDATRPRCTTGKV